MALIVMKFGGTSVGTAERIRESAAIVHNYAKQHQIVVVVSALAGITDIILKAVHAAKSGAQVEAEAYLADLEARHLEAIGKLLSSPHREEIAAEVGALHKQLRDFCSALMMLRSATPQVLDVALPMGEQISARIFAAYLKQIGARGEFIDSARVLVTDEKFGNAAPDMTATRQHSREILLPLVTQGSIPVVTGYSGASKSGLPTTLGRGGSDYSATILGAALGSDEVWIWTDVDGVLTADPRICPKARTLAEITFAEAIELAYYGAKVIHPKAVRPTMELGIPVWIKNSFRPELPGTKIASHAVSNSSPVKAITAVKQACLVALTTQRDVHFAEIFGRLFLRLGHDHTDVLFSTQSSSENSLGLVLRDSDTEHVMQIIQHLFRTELKHHVLAPPSVQRDIAAIVVLGESMRGQWGVLARLFSAVARLNVSVIAVAQGATELNICFAVPSARADEVLRAVHGEFFEHQHQESIEAAVTA